MAKNKFIGEYEFNASKKILFPFISSASGLSQWFADNVNLDPSKKFIFIWDGVANRAEMVVNKLNHIAKFEFENDPEDPNYIEFKLESNELTNAVYLRITDYSEMDADEAASLWENLIQQLKEIVGG